MIRFRKGALNPQESGMASQRKRCRSWVWHTHRLAGLRWGEPELPSLLPQPWPHFPIPYMRRFSLPF